MASTGLVKQVTTLTGSLSVGTVLRDMNKKRRIRRMRRVVIASSQAAAEHCAASGVGYQGVFVTLTYRPGAVWDAAQISGYIQAVNRWAKRHSFRFRYQWVIELTKRGVPHYHVLWWVPFGVRMPKPDESGWWVYGLSRIEKARNPVGYLVKYATKGETDLYSLPSGARLFGVGGGSAAEKFVTHRAGLPMWLHHKLHKLSRGRRVTGVGWVSELTGEVFKSPFELRWWRDTWGVVVVAVVNRESVTC